MAGTIPVGYALVAFVTWRDEAINDITITAGGWDLRATTSGNDPRMVLLHPGVGDRRIWHDLMQILAPEHTAVAYDRRGFGDTTPANAEFANIDDLDAVVATCADGPVVLVGNSQGGRVAIDYALEHPERVARMVLIAPAISGAPDPDWEDELGFEFLTEIEAAEERGDLESINRYEAHIWLDGVDAQEGRVSGPARELFLQMNGVALANEAGVPPSDPPSAIERLDELAMPILVIVGELDLSYQRTSARALAAVVAEGRLVELEGVAHLPQLEEPQLIAELIREFIA